AAAKAAATASGGVGGFVLGALPLDKIASLAGEFTSYLYKKFGKDDVQLDGEPLRVLTPLFLDGLMRLPEATRPVLLFDTFEHTGPFLDRWLRDVLDLRYGDFPGYTVFAIAGRYALGKASFAAGPGGGRPWSDYRDIVREIDLQPFTDAESAAFLSRRGIDAEPVVAAIRRHAQGLPLLLDMLAQDGPKDVAAVPEVADTAVERLLQWVDDENRRKAALLGSLPRVLNEDVVAELTAAKDARAEFAWLQDRAFVEDHGTAGWGYSRIVRELMQRHQRRLSPQGFASAHDRLAHYYEKRRDGLGLDPSRGQKDSAWQGFDVEALYHRLCASPRGGRTAAFENFLTAAEHDRRWARSCADALVQAGRDVDYEALIDQGTTASRLLDADERDDHATAVAALTTLLDGEAPGATARALALRWRARQRAELREFESALADLDTAIELAPTVATAWMDRGDVHQSNGDFAAALDDFDRAVELTPDAVRPRGMRAVLRLFGGDYDGAMTDLDAIRGLEDARLDMLRATVLVRLGRFDEARVEFDRAERRGGEPTQLAIGRADALVRAGRHAEAIDLIDQAIAARPDDYTLLALRMFALSRSGDAAGVRSMQMRLAAVATRFVEQLRKNLAEVPTTFWDAEFRRVAQQLGWGPSGEARVRAMLERLQQADDATVQRIFDAEAKVGAAQQAFRDGEVATAITCLDEALELDPQPNTWTLKGAAAVRQGDPERAAQCFDAALALDGSFVPALACRGELRQSTGDARGAIADFSAILAVQPELGVCRLQRAIIRQTLGERDEALADLGQIIDAGTEPLVRSLAFRAAIRAENPDQLAEARADVDRAHELEPENRLLLPLRIRICRSMHDLDALRRVIAEGEAMLAEFVARYHDALDAGRHQLADGIVIELLTPIVPQQHLAEASAGARRTLALGRAAATAQLQSEMLASDADELVKLGLPDEAVLRFERAIALQPSDRDLRFGHVNALAMTPRVEDALTTCERYLQAHPDDDRLRGVRVDLLRRTGRDEAALAEYDDLIAKYEQATYLLAQRADVLNRLGRHEAAANDVERCLAQNPEDPLALALEPELRWRVRDPDAALAAIDRSEQGGRLSDWDEFVRYLAHESCGHAEPARRALAAATASARQSLARAPDARVDLNLAIYEAADDRLDEATRRVEAAIAAPAHPWELRQGGVDFDLLATLKPERAEFAALGARLRAAADRR
ncbi:MAG: tetratricopeptide repeat protein, partial [Planctomycetes bacterium]|nr:tetratricopeptide repeat protein [Planctomycetota bacterium]